jgi:hypothetical protein
MTTHPVAGGLFISRKTQAFFLFTYVAFLSLFAVFLALYLKEHGKNQTQTMRIKANFGPRGSSSQKGNVASKTDAQEPEWVLSRYVYCTKNPSLTLITMVPPEPELKNVTGASVKQLLSHNIRTLSHMLDPSFEHVILQTAESGETMYGACNALFEQFQGEYMGHVAYDSYALDMNFIGHIRDYLRSHKAAPQLIVFQTVDATTGRVEPAEGSESVLVGGHEPVPSLSQVLFHKKLYVHPAVQKARTKSPQATLEAALNLCSEHEVVWLPLKAFFTHVVDSDIFPRKPEYVTVKLDGGLGNQMFEVATAYAYARDTGKQLVLDRSLTVVSPDAPVSRRTYWQETFSWTDDLPTHSQSCRAKALRASPPSKGDIAPFDAEEAFSFASRKSVWAEDASRLPDDDDFPSRWAVYVVQQRGEGYVLVVLQAVNCPQRVLLVDIAFAEHTAVCGQFCDDRSEGWQIKCLPCEDRVVETNGMFIVRAHMSRWDPQGREVQETKQEFTRRQLTEFARQASFRLNMYRSRSNNCIEYLKTFLELLGVNHDVPDIRQVASVPTGHVFLGYNLCPRSIGEDNSNSRGDESKRPTAAQVEKPGCQSRFRRVLNSITGRPSQSENPYVPGARRPTRFIGRRRSAAVPASCMCN